MLPQHHVPTRVPLAYCSACLLASHTPDYALQTASTSMQLPRIPKGCLPTRKKDSSTTFSRRNQDSASNSQKSNGGSPIHYVHDRHEPSPDNIYKNEETGRRWMITGPYNPAVHGKKV
eukprot:2357640-Rhodomonas_salina.1